MAAICTKTQIGDGTCSSTLCMIMSNQYFLVELSPPPYILKVCPQLFDSTYTDYDYSSTVVMFSLYLSSSTSFFYCECSLSFSKDSIAVWVDGSAPPLPLTEDPGTRALVRQMFAECKDCALCYFCRSLSFQRCSCDDECFILFP